jgi:hypothetical protein
VLLGTGAFDSGGSTPRPLSPLERKAQQVERRLARNPEDKQQLLATMQAWIEAGNNRLSATEYRTHPIPSAVSEDFKAGLRAWNRYLKQTGGEADAEIAELASGTFFQLVEIGSTDPGEAEANAAGAARAQRIAGKQQPTLYTLSNLATYQYFNGEYAAGDRSARGAAADVDKRPDIVFEQLDAYRERAEKFRRRLKRGAEELRESGEEELETPIKGYGSAAGINGYEPGTGPNGPISQS